MAVEAFSATSRRIISVDGEERRVKGRSSYYLLAVADDRGYRKHIEHDGSVREGTDVQGKPAPADYTSNWGLPTKRMLDFLLSIPERKSDLLISFSFTYDTTKILQDLPYEKQFEFAETNETEWRGYHIAGIPKKFLSIRKGDKRVKVWDVFSYWQMSFAKALTKASSLFESDPERVKQIAFIIETKGKRADDFLNMTSDEIREYCFYECEFLSIMYRDMLINFESLGITQKQHGGPGSLAAAFFTSRKVKEHASYGDEHTECGMPRSVPMRAYYGGRFETAVIGNVGDVIQYDIHSAYPAVAVDLPCLQCGMFKRVTEYVPGKWGFYLVESHTSGPWAPFPFRTGLMETGVAGLDDTSKGSIAFVHGGRRWVTHDEVKVAQNHFGKDAIPVLDGWVFTKMCGHKPFAEIGKLYLSRKHPELSRKIGARMNNCIKLLINSVYGKTAQSIGGTADHGPEFQCYPWAAWMTGGTRAKVLEAALLGGEAVVAIATDGILTTKEIPELPVTDWELGTWERKDKKDCWIGMPGIYAFGNEVDSEFKKRGLDSRYFNASTLRNAWNDGRWKVTPDTTPIGFMPLRLAVRRKNWAEVYGQWIEFPKAVNFATVIHKRDFPEDSLPGIIDHDGTMMRLTPYTVGNDVRSMPFIPKDNWSNAYSAGESGDLDLPIWEAEDLDELGEIA